MNRTTPLLLVLAVLLSGCSDDSKLKLALQPLDQSAPRVTLADMRGKVVLIDFWATWCGPCHMAMPTWEHLYREFKDRGFIVMAVTTEDRQTVEKFLMKNPTPTDYPIYLDGLGAVNQAFDVDSIPYAVLLGKNGNVIDTASGYPIDVVKLSKEIDDALKG